MRTDWFPGAYRKYGGLSSWFHGQAMTELLLSGSNTVNQPVTLAQSASESMPVLSMEKLWSRLETLERENDESNVDPKNDAPD